MASSLVELVCVLEEPLSVVELVLEEASTSELLLFIAGTSAFSTAKNN